MASPKVINIMNKGFTLLELLLVITLMTALAAFVFLSFVEYGASQSFRVTVTEVTSVIKETRQKTLSAETITQFGIHVASSSIVVYEGGAYNALNTSNKVISLPGVTLVPQLSGGVSEFTFARLTGEASATGTILITDNRLNSTTSIIIHRSGLVE